jgi:tetratricopeptide (TPR) repeat protein
MFEEEDRHNEEEDFEPSIKKYEQMLKSNERYFFDVEEVETIADYYLDGGELNQALTALDFGLTLHPKSSDLLLRKAQILASIGKLKAAHSLLDQVTALDGEMDDIYITRANLYSQEHNHIKAIEYFLKALELTEEYKEDILIDLAFEYENAGDYTSAIDCLKKVLEENPENEAALYEISYCFGQLDQAEDNIDYLNAFLEENPYSFTAWYNLGNAYSALHLHEKAVHAYEYCALIDSEFSSAYFNAANSYVSLKQYEKAIELYKLTFDYEDAQAVTHNYIGECYEKLGAFQKAEEHFRESLNIDNNFSDAWLGLAIAKDNLGFEKEAVGLIEQAINIDGNNPDYWHVYAESLEKNSRIEEAKMAYEKVLELSPNNVNAIIDISEFIATQDSLVSAIAFLEERLAQLEDAAILYRLVALHLKNGNVANALVNLNLALRIDPKSTHLLTDYYADALLHQEITNMINH